MVAGISLILIGLILVVLGLSLFGNGRYEGGIVWPLVGIAAIVRGRRLLNEQSDMRDARARCRQAEESARKAAEESRIRMHQEEQDGYQEEMVLVGNQSLSVFEAMPGHLRSAGDYLDQAECEFSTRAFGPFWDAIEKVAEELGHFDDKLNEIKDNSSRYAQLIGKYEGVVPPFPLARESIEKLCVGRAVAERMKGIVRTAQRDFQFAMIYEQRRTNRILVAGFTNLAQALDRMTWQIAESMDSLAQSIDLTASTFQESMNAIGSRLADAARATVEHNSEITKLELERRAREERTLEMLDNIQRHRRPMI